MPPTLPVLGRLIVHDLRNPRFDRPPIRLCEACFKPELVGGMKVRDILPQHPDAEERCDSCGRVLTDSYAATHCVEGADLTLETLQL